MNINITAVQEPWYATPGSDPMWTIFIQGQTEPQKTYDKALSVVGSHAAEQYTSKTGKTYWRSPRDYKPAPKTPPADPLKLKQEMTLEVAKNLSIQRQVAAKSAIELIVAGKRDYADLQVTFDDLISLINPKQLDTDRANELNQELDQGFKEAMENDLPPVENYEQ